MTTVQIKVPNLLDRILVLPAMLYRLLKYGYAFRKIYLGEAVWTIVEPKDYYTLKNYNWYF
jgi:hypothetical protein